MHLWITTGLLHLLWGPDILLPEETVRLKAIKRFFGSFLISEVIFTSPNFPQYKQSLHQKSAMCSSVLQLNKTVPFLWSIDNTSQVMIQAY